MDVLLVERDRLIRDQIKVGLQQFPEFTVTCGEGYAAINEVRQRPVGVVFIGCDAREGDTVRLLHHLRSFDRSTDAVIVCGQRTMKELHREKNKLNIIGFVQTPMMVLDFFRLVGRLRSRRAEGDPARSGNAPVPAIGRRG